MLLHRLLFVLLCIGVGSAEIHATNTLIRRRILERDSWNIGKGTVVHVYDLYKMTVTGDFYSQGTLHVISARWEGHPTRRSGVSFVGLSSFLNEGKMMFQLVKTMGPNRVFIECKETLVNSGSINMYAEGKHTAKGRTYEVLPADYLFVLGKAIVNNGAIVAVGIVKATKLCMVAGTRDVNHILVLNNGVICLKHTIWLQNSLINGAGCIHLSTKARLVLKDEFNFPLDQVIHVGPEYLRAHVEFWMSKQNQLYRLTLLGLSQNVWLKFLPPMTSFELRDDLLILYTDLLDSWLTLQVGWNYVSEKIIFDGRKLSYYDRVETLVPAACLCVFSYVDLLKVDKQ